MVAQSPNMTFSPCVSQEILISIISEKRRLQSQNCDVSYGFPFKKKKVEECDNNISKMLFVKH